MVDTLLENPDFSSKRVLEGVTFLIPSLMEVYRMYENSSTMIAKDGSVIVNGKYANCTPQSYTDEVTDYTFMAIAILFLTIFAFFIKRISFKSRTCGGRPGPLMPMGMLDSHDQIIEFTLAFLSVSEDIYTFIFGFKSDFGQQIPIVKFFIKLAVVVSLSITSYLTFAGLQNRYLIGYVFGATMSACYSYGGIATSITTGYCLASSKTIPFIFAAFIYSSIDLSLLTIFIVKIFKHISKNGMIMKERKENLCSDQRFCVRYVKMLLKEKPSLEKEESEDIAKPFFDLLKCDKLKEKMSEKIYKKIPGFSIPPRLIIGISVGLFFAYRIFIDQISAMTPTIWNFINLINSRYDTTYTNLSASFKVLTGNYSVYSESEIQNAYRFLTFFYIHLLVGCALSAIVFGFLNSVAQSFLILRNYRLNFHRITQNGFPAMIALDRAPQPYLLILGFVRFSGYQAAYILWGILVVSIVITLLLYFLIGFFLLPLFYVDNSWSRKFVINYGPVLLASLILNFVQTLIVKYIFVKEKGELMEINNRRAFIIFSHCAFFLNAMMGLFASIKRIIIWTFFGVICFCRVDFSSLPDYLHGCDNGYMSYIGFIYTEQYHHNPILRYFVNILLESRKGLEVRNMNQSEMPLEMNMHFENNSQLKINFRNKWRVAYTLLRNHSLLAKRKCFLTNSVL